MSTQAHKLSSRNCLAIVLLGAAVSVTGCAKKKTAQQVPPPASLVADNSVVTGSISPPASAAQLQTPQKTKGKVLRIKTASLGNTTTAVATRKARNKITLAFPKKGYSLSGDQSAQLERFVKDAGKNKKRVKVIGIATAKKGKASKATRTEASRRAKATSMFLRVYGVESDNMTITTADAKPRKGLSPRRVEVVFQ